MMEAYKQRVVDEKSELDEKLVKLRAFFTNDLFNGLPKDEQDRLKRQEVVMSEYSDILDERIKNFKQ